MSKLSAKNTGQHLLTALFTVIAWMMMVGLMALGNPAIILAVFIVCGFFGWPKLYKLTPSLFIFAVIFISWTKLAIYGLVKAILSVLAGFFIVPYLIGRKLSDRLQKVIP